MLVINLLVLITAIVSLIIILKTFEVQRKTFNVQIKSFEEQKRPYVFLNIEKRIKIIPKSQTQIFVYTAVLKNSGLLPAFDIKVSINPDIKCKFVISFLKIKPSFIPPRGEIETDISLTDQFYIDNPDPNFLIQISYKDYDGKLYEDKEYLLSLDYMRNALHIGV